MDDDIARDVRRGVTRLSRRLRGARSEAALSAAKVGVLSHLARHGPSTPSRIAAADGQQPQALTRVIAELEAARLVVRAPSPTDGRAVVLTATAAGSAAVKADMRERDAWLATALLSLSPTELGVLQLAAPLLERLADLPPDLPREPRRTS